MNPIRLLVPLVPLVALAVGGCCGAVPLRGSRPAGAYEERARELRRGDARRYRVMVAKPFVLVSDVPQDLLQRIAGEVVEWAAGELRRELFTHEPESIHTIWAFRHEYSYRIGVSEVFNGAPRSIYGFYSPCHDAVFINLGLGTGTLVHEMVHPLLEADFPQAPIWLNEGIASLYEHTESVEGRMRGRTNWRLPPLQNKLRARASHEVAPWLREVMAMARRAFYAPRRKGHNYAVARYVAFYLQERGLLSAYYDAFRRNHRDDPDGIATLERISGMPLDRFGPHWRRFVLALRYPEARAEPAAAAIRPAKRR